MTIIRCSCGKIYQGKRARATIVKHIKIFPDHFEVERKSQLENFGMWRR